MATELVVKLRVSGDKDVDAALKRIGQAAQDAGVKLTPMNQGLGRASEQARVALRAMGNLAQTLSGTAALLSVVSRGNKDLQERFEKLTVVLALTSTALSLARNATETYAGAKVFMTVVTLKAAAALVAFRTAAATAWAAALGPLGAATVLIGGLVLVIRELHKESGQEGRWGKGLVQVLQEWRDRGKEAADELGRVYRFSQAMGGRTGSFSASDIVAANEALEKHNKELEKKSIADAKSAEAARDQAHAIREAREAIENETNDLLLGDAAAAKAADTLRRFNDETKNLIFDARDGARAVREAAAAQEAWNEELAARDMEDAIQRARLLALEMGNVANEAQRAAGWMGRSTPGGAADAAEVISDTQARMQAAAGEAITIAGRIAEVNEQAAIDSLNAWLASQEGIAPNWTELAQIVNQAISQIVAGQGEAAQAAVRAAATAKSAWMSGVDGILSRLGVLRNESGSIWEEIKNAAIRALAQIVASKIWDAIAARLKGIGGAGRGLISGALSLIPGIGPILGGIASIFGLQHGGSFITQGPTPLMVGEGHERELVQVTPFSKLGRGGGLTVVVQVQGNILETDPWKWDAFAQQHIAPAVARHLRLQGAL